MLVLRSPDVRYSHRRNGEGCTGLSVLSGQLPVNLFYSKISWVFFSPFLKEAGLRICLDGGGHGPAEHSRSYWGILGKDGGRGAGVLEGEIRVAGPRH